MRSIINNTESHFISLIHQNKIEESETERKQKLIKKTHDVVDVYLMLKPDRFNPEDFSDIYPQTEIEKDLEEQQIAKKNDEPATRGGMLMENMAADLFESWYGKNVKLSFTAEKDDRDGQDAVMEIKFTDKQGNEKIASILIDFTTSEKPDSTNSKLDISSEKIKGGTLSRIKYFASKFNGKRGSLENAPRVVAGASIDTLINVCMQIANNEADKKNHFVQLLLLDEMHSQLIQLNDEAQKLNCNTVVQNSLAEAKMALDELLKQKEHLRTRDYKQRVLRDKVFLRLHVGKEKLTNEKN